MPRFHVFHAAFAFVGLAFCSIVAHGQQESLEGVVAVVNTDVVTFSQVRELAEPKERQAHETLRGDELVQKIKEIRLQELNDLIDRALIIQEFKATGRAIPESLVDDRIAAIVRDEFGGDEKAFLHHLNAQGYTLEKFRSLQRDIVTVSVMHEQVTKGVTDQTEREQREQAWLKKLRAKAFIKVY